MSKRMIDADEFFIWIDKQIRDAQKVILDNQFEVSYYNALRSIADYSITKINITKM